MKIRILGGISSPSGFRLAMYNADAVLGGDMIMNVFSGTSDAPRYCTLSTAKHDADWSEGTSVRFMRLDNVIRALGALLALAFGRRRGLRWGVGLFASWTLTSKTVAELLELGFLPRTVRHRLFQWHACEHKTARLLESAAPRTTDTLRAQSAILLRCGTTTAIPGCLLPVAVYALSRVKTGRLAARAGAWLGIGTATIGAAGSLSLLCQRVWNTREPTDEQIAESVALARKMDEAFGRRSPYGDRLLFLSFPPRPIFSSPVVRDRALRVWCSTTLTLIAYRLAARKYSRSRIKCVCASSLNFAPIKRVRVRVKDAFRWILPPPRAQAARCLPCSASPTPHRTPPRRTQR